MKETMLRGRFPAYRPVATSHEIDEDSDQKLDDSFAQGDISPRHSTIKKVGLVLLGKSTRTPNQWLKPQLEANVQFHAAFQARERRARVADPALSGLYYQQDTTGGSYTDRATLPIVGCESYSPNLHSSITTYEEAQLTPFEKKLHSTHDIYHSAASYS
jgi:hypothetical protein